MTSTSFLIEVQIPDEMFRKGRPVDNNFSQDEDLYIRFESVFAGKVPVDSIKAIDQSVNRSKYSKPHCVLITENKIYADWGYGAIKVGKVPDSITEQDITFNYQVEHDPKEKNYSHSEIRAYKNGDRVTSNSRRRAYFKEIAARYRVEFSRNIKILKMPNPF